MFLLYLDEWRESVFPLTKLYPPKNQVTAAGNMKSSPAHEYFTVVL